MSVNIHFKSDFKLFESPAKDASFTFLVPFRFAYYTVGNVEYVVSHSNGEYTNCELLEDGRLKVIFENHGLAPGRIMCRREFFLTDEDYADNICDVRLTTATDVFLTMQGRDVGDITVKVPMFYQKGDKGDPFTWDDMTPEQRAYFIEQVGADVVATNEAVIAAEAARQQYYEQWKPEAERVTNDARTQGMYAATEGLYAKNRGDEAKAYGDYAKEQGDLASSRGAFAKIQAEYAIEKAGEAMRAALSANEVSAAANIAAADATTAAQKATDEGDYAKGQGDYAKVQGDKALEATSEAYEVLDQVREVITKSNRATANADEAAAEAIEATNRVNESIGKAESAASSADYAREQLEALEIELTNADNRREDKEAIRKEQEDIRQQNEAKRQSDSATAVSNAQAATSAAKQATSSANSAATAANTAADSVEQFKNETTERVDELEIKVVNQPYDINNSEIYGYYRGQWGVYWDKNNPAPIYLTYANSASPRKALLKRIRFGLKYNATAKFGIGIIDQRNMPVIRTTFEAEGIAGENNIDILGRGIDIEPYEQLFYIIDSATNVLLFENWTTESEEQINNQMLYGSKTLKPLGGGYGGSIALAWETVEVTSIFASKSEVKTTEEQASEAKKLATSALSNVGIFSDRLGNKYKGVVINGALSLIPLQYSKVVVFCNSIGVNGRIYSMGWCARRGMAASRNGLDYYSHLQTAMQTKVPTASVTMCNVWEWEANFAHSYTNYANVLTNDVDCIIFRIGENVKDTASFESELTDFVNYAGTMCPNAEIMITSMVWTDTVKDTALLNVAIAGGYLYADVSANTPEYKERVGNYLYGDYTNDGGTTWDTNIQVLYPILNVAIANHTNDVGMLRIANNILEALKYPSLNLIHQIKVGETNGHSCEMLNTEWVENGVVNVVTDGSSVSVVDANGAAIAVTNHNDGVFTFEMPNSDVTITIS